MDVEMEKQIKEGDFAIFKSMSGKSYTLRKFFMMGYGNLRRMGSCHVCSLGKDLPKAVEKARTMGADLRWIWGLEWQGDSYSQWYDSVTIESLDKALARAKAP